jgi:hypothetical protein
MVRVPGAARLLGLHGLKARHQSWQVNVIRSGRSPKHLIQHGSSQDAGYPSDESWPADIRWFKRQHSKAAGAN